MPGPTQPWDQSGDPRESTVDLPRLDLTELADYFRGGPGLPEPAARLDPLPEPDPSRPSAPIRQPDPSELGRSSPSRRPELTGFRHPYAEPDLPYRPPRREPTRTEPTRTEPTSTEPTRTRAVEPPVTAPPADPGPAPSINQAPVSPHPVPPGPPPVAYTADPPSQHPVLASPAPAASATPKDADEPLPAARVAVSVPPTAIIPTQPALATATTAPPEPLPAVAASDRLAVQAGAPSRAAGPGASGPAGSLADLRSRLARLPDGHPSSPYDDGGQARPLPTRLKQLELGPPAPGRGPAGSFLPNGIEVDHSGADRAGVDHSGLDDAELAADELPEPDLHEQDLAEPDRAEPSLPATDHTALDEAPLDGAAVHNAAPRADDLSPPADPARDFEPGPAPPLGFSPADATDDAHSPFPVQDRDAHRPARPEWENPYAADGNGHAATDRPADLNLGPWQPSQPPRVSGLEGLSARSGNGHGRSNGAGSGHHQRTSQPAPPRLDPGQRDAARRDTVQHQTVQPGARRHDSGPPRESAPPRETGPRLDTGRHDTGQRHGPPDAGKLDVGGAADLRALADRTLALCRAAEGRNVIGNYGSSGLTPAVERIAARLPFGGLAPGSEANSLKSTDRFAAKLARLIARNPGRPPEDLAAAISDAVRYAFVFEAADYVEGTWLVHRRFKAYGFDLEIRRNRWENPEYKGIFSQWRDPAHHLAFEVQFHTTASWAVLQRTYDDYIRITNPATPPAERARLRARQEAAAAGAKAPPNWTEIGDFRQGQR
jgi:hypothetical protein